jgi:hypothetical protein
VNECGADDVGAGVELTGEELDEPDEAAGGLAGADPQPATSSAATIHVRRLRTAAG